MNSNLLNYLGKAMLLVRKAHQNIWPAMMIALFITGCNEQKNETPKGYNGSSVAELKNIEMHWPEEKDITHAKADIKSLSNPNILGVVEFWQKGDGVEVTANIQGLTPGKHGFHIHQYGECSSADYSAVGSHFNPTENEHGAPGANVHRGDFGNLVADDEGKASYKASFDFLKLQGRDSILGRSVIIHQGEDDLTSQPSGNSGQKIACGVIEPVFDQID